MSHLAAWRRGSNPRLRKMRSSLYLQLLGECAHPYLYASTRIGINQSTPSDQAHPAFVNGVLTHARAAVQSPSSGFYLPPGSPVLPHWRHGDLVFSSVQTHGRSGERLSCGCMGSFVCVGSTPWDRGGAVQAAPAAQGVQCRTRLRTTARATADRDHRYPIAGLG